jgi:hypothetical protein
MDAKRETQTETRTPEGSPDNRLRGPVETAYAAGPFSPQVDSGLVQPLGLSLGVRSKGQGGVKTGDDKMKNETLRLVAGRDCWMVDYSETSEAERIRELFLTCLIPTPYGLSNHYTVVQNRIQTLNPQYDVR